MKNYKTLSVSRAVSQLIMRVHKPTVAYKLGSFSIDDGNSIENVSFKMNSRLFNLCRVDSNLLKMASVDEFPWSWFLKDRT